MLGISRNTRIMNKRPLAAVILAAGKGTRMGVSVPKVCVEFRGKPLIAHVLAPVEALFPERIILIVGNGREIVEEAARAATQFPVEFVEQREQQGTGHAVKQSETLLSDFPGDILVRYGDTPLITTRTLSALMRQHQDSEAAATFLTAHVKKPFGYGRVKRDVHGRPVDIIEERNTNEEEKRINEINVGAYCFRAEELFTALARLTPNSVNGEYYLTELIPILAQSGKIVHALISDTPDEIHGINTTEQLEQIDKATLELVPAH